MTVVNNKDELWTAANDPAATLIELGDGPFDPVWLPVIAYSPGLVIRPAAGAKPQISNVGVGSQNLTIQGIHLLLAPATQYGFDVEGAVNVVFDGVSARQADSNIFAGTGIFLRDTKNVTIKNSEFSYLGCGIGQVNTLRTHLIDNELHDISTDFTITTGSTYMVVTGNDFTNLRIQPDSGHPDALQFAQCAQVTIAQNTVRRGDGDPVQGIFIENSQHIEIHQNALHGTDYNGISVSNSTDIDITDNLVQGWTDRGSQVIVRGGSDNVVASDNTTSQPVSDYSDSGRAPNTNMSIVNTTTVDPATGPLDVGAMNKWLAARGTLAGPALEIPVPVALAGPLPDPDLTGTLIPTLTPLEALQGQIDDLTAQNKALQANVNLAEATLALRDALLAKYESKTVQAFLAAFAPN